MHHAVMRGLQFRDHLHSRAQSGEWFEDVDGRGRRLTPQCTPVRWVKAETFRSPRSSFFRHKPSSLAEMQTMLDCTESG